MAKKYFNDYNECCYTLQYHLEYMKENGIKEMKVYEAKAEWSSGMFFCKEVYEVGESVECGRSCKDYKPRNGKSGICKNHGYTYEQTDKVKILKIN